MSLLSQELFILISSHHSRRHHVIGEEQLLDCICKSPIQTTLSIKSVLLTSSSCNQGDKRQKW